MKRNSEKCIPCKRYERNIDKTSLWGLSAEIQRLFPWKTSKANNRFDLNGKVSFRVVSECDIDLSYLDVNRVEFVSKAIRTGRELKRITVQLNDYSVSDDSMKALQCIYEMLKSGMIPDEDFSVCGLFYLRPDGAVAEHGLTVLSKNELERWFKRGVTDDGTWILVTNEDLLNENWNHPYMSVTDGVFTSSRGNERRGVLQKRKRTEGLVRDAVDAEGIKAFWEEAFALAVESLKDNYSVEESMDGIYITMTDRFGYELSYQGYVAFEGVEGEELILHMVWPDDVSVLQSAKVFSGVENAAPLDSVGIDGISNVSEKEAVMDEISEIIDALKDAKKGVEDYMYSQIDADIADSMSGSGTVEVVKVSLPDENHVDYDPEYHDDERAAVLLAAGEAVVSEIEYYVQNCARDADKFISRARDEIEDLEQSIQDDLTEAEQLLKKIDRSEPYESRRSRRRR